MKASDYIVSFLTSKKIPYVFGYIGGMVAHLIDSLYQSDKIQMVNTIQEQGAGFAADGYARTTDKTAVAIATSGPGATNLLTPLADCYFDSIPAVFMTGNVNTFEYRKYPKIRQTGFQETDIVSMVKPVTKYAVRVDKAENLRYELEKAFFVAQDGRKGPVLLDLPMDIQRTDFDFTTARSFLPEKQAKFSLNKKLTTVINKLKKSKTPLVLVGHGIGLSKTRTDLQEFLKKENIPVVESLLGLDAVPTDYEYNLGLIGTYGNRYANIALSIADTILVLGSRLDIRQIGANTDIFKDKTIIQVDIDKNELTCTNLKKDQLNLPLPMFFQMMKSKNLDLDISKWRRKVLELKKAFPSTKNIDATINVPNQIVSNLSQCLRPDDVICVDVGQHQMWAAQSSIIKEKTRFMTSGGLGSMGFALPAAIGAALSGHRAVVISGDGGFQMNIQELETIKRRNLPVKIIIMNNHCLGMVRQFQEAYFDKRCPSTIVDYSTPNFEKIAKAYGIKAFTKKPDDLSPQFWKKFFANDQPALLNVTLNQQTKIVPKVMYGHTIDDMSPFLTKKVLEKIKGLEK